MTDNSVGNLFMIVDPRIFLLEISDTVTPLTLINSCLSFIWRFRLERPFYPNGSRLTPHNLTVEIDDWLCPTFI